MEKYDYLTIIFILIGGLSILVYLIVNSSELLAELLAILGEITLSGWLFLILIFSFFGIITAQYCKIMS